MDRDRFDALTKSLVSRRAGIGVGLVALLGIAADDAEAKKKKPCGSCKQRKQGKCKPKPNGTRCGNGVCRNGRCAACAAGQTVCGGACVDLQSNLANCGVCGNACGANQLCANGQCLTGRGTCGAQENACANPGAATNCNGDPNCFCFLTQPGQSQCGRYYEMPGGGIPSCTSDADCAGLAPGVFCSRPANSCGGACTVPCPTLG